MNTREGEAVMRRLLILCTDYKPALGGIAEWVHQVALALRAHGEVVLFAPENGAAADFDAAQPYRTLRAFALPGATLRSKLAALRRHRSFVRALSQFGPDYVLAADDGAYEGYLGYLRWRAVRRLGVPCGIMFHGQDVECAPQIPWPRRSLLARAVQSMDDVFSNSHFTAGVARAAYGLPRPPRVVGCGVCPTTLPAPESQAAARAALGITASHVILTASRLLPRKGIDMVLRGLPGVRARFPGLLYLVFGAGDDLERLRRLAGELGCADCVRFEGRVAQADLGFYYCAADLFVMPSRHIPGESVEGFGIVYAEAGYYGLPVIGGRAGGVPEVVLDGRTGLLVDPENPADIAAAIVSLLEDPAWRRELGAAGRTRVHEDLTWSHVAARVARAIDARLACDRTPDGARPRVRGLEGPSTAGRRAK